MFKGEDVVLLLKIGLAAPAWTIRALADETGIPRSAVHRSLKRLAAAGLWDERARRVNVSQAEEFLVHAVRYVFPATVEGESRGVATAWAAPPLVDHIASPSDGLSPVWPDPRGQMRGLAVRPLHAAVPAAARRDPELGERLALVDALRLGDARVRDVATRMLVERLERSTG